MTTTADESGLAYCMKCKEKRTVNNPEEVDTANGRRALRGTCGECGTKVQKFLPAKVAEAGD